MQDGKYVILCIDDDQDILESLRLVLEANGYIMLGAATGEEGLRIYKQTKPDLLIVDLMMEEVDAGTSFVRELKASGNTAPIYMLSSVGDSLNLSADYSELGLTGVFQKPIDPETLLTILRKKLK
ncbi:MAG: response regulator [Verrucomicrobia bacterium]|nr:response regulator [Verrucomicrobiota bacterium]